MSEMYLGEERRRYTRSEYKVPLMYKVCKEEILSKLLEGYVSNISQSGLLCNINDKVNIDNILWLMFDRETLSICKELEKNSFIYQKGVLGKVVRVEGNENGSFDIGIKFLTREEKNPYIFSGKAL